MISSWPTVLAATIPLLVAAAYLAYRYSTYYYGYWAERGVPHAEPTTLLGHFARPILGRENSAFTVDSHYRRFGGHRYFGMYQLRHPILVLRDPELAHAVLTKDFASFHDRLTSRTSFKHDQLFSNVVNLTGDRWKAVRAKLTPTFTTARLKTMFADLYVCTDRLMNKLSLLTSDDQGVVNVTDIISKFTIDTIGRCAFGLDCNSLFDSNSEFQRAGEAVFRPTVKMLLHNFMRLIDIGWLIDLLRLRSMPDYVYEFYLNIFHDTLKLRDTEVEDRNDFVSILIKLRNKEKENNNKVGK
uniref:Cytochrome p450 n=1 Tax=Sipha flava TaxID=143950 RepID=A0A2S2R270_9HEMI